MWDRDVKHSHNGDVFQQAIEFLTANGRWCAPAGAGRKSKKRIAKTRKYESTKNDFRFLFSGFRVLAAGRDPFAASNVRSTGKEWPIWKNYRFGPAKHRASGKTRRDELREILVQATLTGSSIYG